LIFNKNRGKQRTYFQQLGPKKWCHPSLH